VEFNIVSAPVSAAMLPLSHLRRHFHVALHDPRRICWRWDDALCGGALMVATIRSVETIVVMTLCAVAH
jgi:hypothetical protein